MRAVVVQPNGKILIGGDFTTVAPNGGAAVTRNRMARLNADGTLDATFNPNANDYVFPILVQSNGKMLVGGQFTTLAPNDGAVVTRNHIARLNADGTLDTGFDPNADGSVLPIAVQADGKILAGGQFTAVGGQARSLFARLSNDTAALSTLTVTRTTVTLMRDGAAQQFSRVVFEQSTNNGATYTLLGTAVPSFVSLAADGKDENRFAPTAPQAASYTLTGLNLPTGQNILIRARGYYQNGSETIEDKVQNAFFAAGPTAASVSVSGRVISPLNLGLTSAFVTLTDMQGNSRTVFTGKGGRFMFTDVGAGETYILSVRSKRYTYTPQVINVTEDMAEVNFAPQ